MVTKNTNDVVPEHNTQSNEKKECRPLNVFSGSFICLLLLSIVWTFYSVAIEILPMQEYQKNVQNIIQLQVIGLHLNLLFAKNI